MAEDSPTFRWTAEALERNTYFSGIQARGTVRLAVKKAGFNPALVTREEMIMILERILPRELSAREVADAEKVCADLILGLEAATLHRAGPVNPEDAFRSMFGGPKADKDKT